MEMESFTEKLTANWYRIMVQLEFSSLGDKQNLGR